MSAKANYFKLGLFMLGSAALLVAGVIILGAGALNKSMLPMETYVEGSVQGLSVGAPVKFRGVPIGRVDEIGFAGTVYPQAKNTTMPDAAARSYVMITFSVHPDILAHQSIPDSELPGAIAREVERGLRIRMATIGITGNAYLELDYLDPASGTPLPIDWAPKKIYIPSASGQLSRIVSSAENILNQVQNAGIPKVVDHLDKLLIDADQAIADLDIPALKRNATMLFDDVRQSNASLKKILDNPRIPEIMDSTALAVSKSTTTLDHVNKVIDNVNGVVDTAHPGIAAFANDLPAISANLKNLSEKLDKILASDSTKKTLDGLATTSDDLPRAVAQLQRTLRRIDSLVSTQQQDISAIIQNLRAATANLNQLTDNAKRHPSEVIFGEPPPRTLNGDK